jgi:type IV secretion system protein TrbL
MMRAPILLLFAVALLAPEPAFAQAACSVGNANDNSLDQIVNLYRSCARQWEATLGAHALTLFWLLAAIEFVWAAIRLVLRGADFNEWLAELATQVFFLGLFLALLTNATAWTGAIVESFRTAAAEALRANGVASGIAPSDIFDTGVNIATRMLEQFSIFSAPVQSLFLVAASLVILVCFALIAAALILALVESYIVLSAGVLLLGFGGSRWTKDFAVKTLIYAVSVGAKLFVLQLIAGLGAQIVGAWARLPVSASLFSPANATSNILVILGSTLVLWVLVKTVPDMIQGLINGTALGVNPGLASAVASLAGSAYALGMVVSNARDLSREQITEAQLANPGQSGPGMARRSLGNIGSAAIANIGHRLSGRAVHGDRIGQVAGALHREAGDLRSERERRERDAQRSATSPSTTPSSPQPTLPPGGSATPPQSSATRPSASMGTAANENTPPSPPKKP